MTDETSAPDEPAHVQFTPKKLLLLLFSLEQAQRDKADFVMVDGKKMDVGYAAYVVQHLIGQDILPKEGLTMIAASRAEQITKFGYNAQHDQEHVNQEIGWLALSHMLSALDRTKLDRDEDPVFDNFKDIVDAHVKAVMPDVSLGSEDGDHITGVNHLVKASALCCAEIDRRVIQVVLAQEE